MVQAIETKRCQANFKSPGREHFEELQSSWVNQVEVGKYKPKYHLIEPNQEKTHIYRKEQPNLGSTMKNYLGVQNMKICPHAIRVLEKNSSFRTKDPSPTHLKNIKANDKTGHPLADGTLDKEIKKSDSIEDDV